MSDFSAAETPADLNLTSIVSVIDEPVRSAMLAALAGRLRVTDSFDDRIDQWLAT